MFRPQVPYVGTSVLTPFIDLATEAQNLPQYGNQRDISKMEN